MDDICHEYTDIFYKFCYGAEEGYSWEEALGKKIEIGGREMFEKDGEITDGRTGMRAASEQFPMNESKIKKIVGGFCKEVESKIYEISPLYDENTELPIKGVKYSGR